MNKKRIAVTLIAALTSELVNKLAPLVTLHIAATKLGASSFGRSQFSLWLLEWGILIVSFGYAQAIPVAIRNAPSNLMRKQLGGALVIARLLHALLAICILAIIFWQSPSYREYWPIVSSSLFIMIASAFDFSGVLIATQKVSIYSLITILTKILSVLAVIVFIQSPDDALPYVLITNLANGIVCLGSFAYGVATSGLARPTSEICWNLMRIAAPFAAANFVLVLLERFDLYLIEKNLGAIGAGWYSGPAKMTQSILPLIVSVSTVFYSEMVAIQNTTALRRHFRVGLLAVFAFILPIAVGVQFAGAQILEIIFGEGFGLQKSTLSILVTGAIPHTLIIMVGYQLLGLRQKMTAVNLALITGALIGIVTGVHLTELFQYEGAATANTTAKFISALIVILAGLRYKLLTAADILGPLFKTGIPALAMGACLGALAIHTQLSPMGLILCGAAIYWLALIFLNANDLKRIVQKIMQAIRSRRQLDQS